jgi:lauroyl/myristoyl acyltransferase
VSAEPPSHLPPALRQDWPVPRQDALGERSGARAWLEYAAGRGALSLVPRLPDAARERFVEALARLARRVDRSHSDAARDFLATAFPGEDRARTEQRVLQAWRHFLRVTIESAGFERRVGFAALGAHLDGVDVHPEAERLRRRGTGTIFVPAHLGDWEMGPSVLAHAGFDPFYAVVKPPKNRPLSAHLQRIREARGLRSLPRRGAMQHASAVLRAGGCLGMVLDQRARVRPVLAPYFGRLARCDRSAGVLMKRLRTPVLVGACLSTGPWRWRLSVPTVIQPEELADADAIVTRLNAEFETLIRAAPDQYFWLHDRYRGATVAEVEAEAARARGESGT